MKIFAVSDTHGDLGGLDPSGCDAVVVAGDFAPLGGFGKEQILEQKKWITEEFGAWVGGHPEIQFVVVPGNHDLFFDSARSGAAKEDFARLLPENAKILIDEEFSFSGVRFYGTPWVPVISRRWAFEAETPDLASKFSAIPAGLDVLVTHVPPHLGSSCGIDRSLQWGGREAFGSCELADAIARKSPRFVFCGHIHSGTHGPVEFFDSKIYNVSRVDERYEIAYDPVVVEI